MKYKLVAFYAAAIPLLLGCSKLPNEEKRFVELVQDFQASYKDANSIVKDDLAKERAKELCATGIQNVSGWVGEIHELINSDLFGGAKISVKLADNIYVENALLDLVSEDEPLSAIKPNEAVFNSLREVKVGDEVRFSGSFIRGTECFRETSVTQGGSMTAPEFAFKFTSIEPT